MTYIIKADFLTAFVLQVFFIKVLIKFKQPSKSMFSISLLGKSILINSPILLVISRFPLKAETKKTVIACWLSTKKKRQVVQLFLESFLCRMLMFGSNKNIIPTCGRRSWRVVELLKNMKLNLQQFASLISGFLNAQLRVILSFP